MVKNLLAVLIFTIALCASANAENNYIHSNLLSQTSSKDEDNPLLINCKAPMIFFGITGGYNSSLHKISHSNFVIIEDYPAPEFENSQMNSYYAGITFEFLFEPTNFSNSILANLVFTSQPAYFKEQSLPYPSKVMKSGHTIIILSTTKQTLEVTYNLVSLETLYKQNLFGSSLGIVLGPTFDFAVMKSYKQKFSLDEPSNSQFVKPEDWESKGLRFEDNDRSLILDEGEMNETSTFRLGLKAGIQFEMFFEGLYLVPSISYNYGITTFNSDMNWRINAIQLGIGIRTY